MKTFATVLGCTLFAAATLSAAENLPKTLMTERGKLLLSEDFAKPVAAAPAIDPTLKGAARKAAVSSWTSGWRLRPGQWEFAGGAMKGTELAADKHGAVARVPFAFKDAVIQYDVRLDGCKQTTFSVNDAGEHVCRVLINKDGFKAQKDDHDHTGPDKAKAFNTVALPLAPGTWHTVVIELKGEEMVATIDGKSSSGSDPLIAVAKANFGFTVSGDGASFRNLRVWEAKPNANWPQNKKLISAVTK
jgi:hypothetical protein